MKIDRELIEKVLDIFHEVLQEKSIREDLRIKLVGIRSDLEWEVEINDNPEKDHAGR